MPQESIDDIFKDLDLKKDTKASKTAKKVLRFVQNDTFVNKIKSNKIDDDYFNERLISIKKDANYMSLKELLIPKSYDLSNYNNNDLLKEKYGEKQSIIKLCYAIIYGHKYHLQYRLERKLNRIKDDELFIEDYFYYYYLVKHYLYFKKYEDGINVIKEFFSSNIYCNDTVVEYFIHYLKLYLNKINFAFNEEYFDLINKYNEKSIYFKKPKIPITDRIYKYKKNYYLISEEKYEFNQSLKLLQEKTITSRHFGYKNFVEFNIALLDCNILYFKSLAYQNLQFISKILGSKKFLNTYLNSLKNKNSHQNILQKDFNRLYSSKQIEFD